MAAKRKAPKAVKGRSKATKATPVRTKKATRTTRLVAREDPTVAGPTQPGGDGEKAVSVLATFCDWEYGAGEDPVEPTQPVSAATARGDARDWAAWVKRKLEKGLEAELAQSGLPPRKKERLEAALRRVQAWA